MVDALCHHLRQLHCRRQIWPDAGLRQPKCNRGLAGASDLGSIWMTWWLGDAVGAWLFGTLLLSWSHGSRVHWTRRRAAEAALLGAVLLIVANLVFGGWNSGAGRQLPFEFLCIPVLLWPAFRFGQREATSAAALLSLLAVAGTIGGSGPFARAQHNQALVLLQAYMGVVTI